MKCGHTLQFGLLRRLLMELRSDVRMLCGSQGKRLAPHSLTNVLTWLSPARSLAVAEMWPPFRASMTALLSSTFRAYSGDAGASRIWR
jgi:hypothetical protein